MKYLSKLVHEKKLTTNSLSKTHISCRSSSEILCIRYTHMYKDSLNMTRNLNN